MLGWFTIVRLIDTSVANIISLRRMELIRAYYATLTPAAPPYFGPDGSSAGQHSVRYGRWSFLFTMASMVITVNCLASGSLSHGTCSNVHDESSTRIPGPLLTRRRTPMTRLQPVLASSNS